MVTKALAPIEDNRRTLAAQVVERIRQAILDQSLPPGSRINQYKLAEDLNVSLVPVREALKELEAEGLVSITPRRGAFVTEISFDDLDELYFARRLMEGEAIALACRRLSEEDFQTLTNLMSAMQASTDQGAIHPFMQQNRAFHMHIYAAADNRYLKQIIENLWERSELYRYRYMFVLRNADVIHQEHDDIFNACRDGDAERARQLIHEHIWHTRNGIYEHLVNDFSHTSGEQTE
jgi:DNA-binding GntR family transcriptional regulator